MIKINKQEKSHKNMVNISKTKKSVAFFEANPWLGNEDKIKSKILILMIGMFLLMVVLAPMASAKNFNITSNGNDLFFVNGTSGNVTIVNTGFFSRIGDSITRVTKGWFTDLDVSGTFNVGTQTATNLWVSNNATIGKNLSVGGGSLFVDAESGKVGIGTAAPGAKLEVKDGDIWLNGATSSSNPEIFFIDDSGVGVAGAKIRYGNGDGNVYFDHKWDNAGSGFFFRNRVDGTALNTMALVNGNVGIGTTSPTSLLYLQAADGAGVDSQLTIRVPDGAGAGQSGDPKIYFSTGAGGTEDWTMGVDNSDSDKFKISNSNVLETTNYLTIDGTNGNVGIGTTGPNQILHLARANTDNYIKVEAGGQGAYYSGIMLTESAINWGWALRHNAATDLLHISYQDNTPTFSDTVTFTRTGNVGIGTTNPGANLHINDGGVGDQEVLRISQLGNTGSRDIVGMEFKFNNGAVPGGRVQAIKLDNAGSALAFSTGAASNGALGEHMRITSTGNVGIGTTGPKNKLDVEGGAVIGATYSGTNTAPTNGLLIEGNVGIGTTSPNAKLEVTGDVIIDLSD